MTAHLHTIPGPAADFAAVLARQIPRLETPRTVLRAPILSDAPHWIRIATGDTEGHLGGPYDANSAFTDFAATVGLWLLRGHGLWTVTDHEGTVLGFVLIGFEPGDEEPELGFLFLPEARGRGLARESAEAARKQALEVMGLPSLVSYIAPGNGPSRRLAQNLGAWRDGTVDEAEIWRHSREALG